MRKNGNRLPLHYRVIGSVTGMSYTTLFTIWMTLAAGFAVIYALLATFAPSEAPAALLDLSPLDQLGNAVYFSIITATSTGYGDIVPLGFSKTLASIQSISSLFIFAVLVGKLVSQQQEIAVKQMHRLTYEDVLHNTREGFFIIRKDFDHTIGKVERREPLTMDDWEDLATAYKQGQNLFLEIPEFYSPEDDALYTVDEQREQLLMEAVQRTLHRINHMIDSFSIAEINWTAHPESVRELKELLKVAGHVLPRWHEYSPYQKRESFDVMLRLRERAINRLDQALPR